MLRGPVVAILLLAAASVDAAVTLLPGSSPQSARANVPFANPVVVRVTDDNGTAIAGAHVDLVGLIAANSIFAVDDPTCGYNFAYVCTVTSDADGIARFPALVGRLAGTFTDTITAYRGSQNVGSTQAVFTVLALRPAAEIAIVSGASQRAVIGTPYQPIVVRLTSHGTQVAFVDVYYQPMIAGPGSTGSVKTDAFGMATLPPFVAPWGVGTTTVTISFLDAEAPAWVTTTTDLVSTNAQGGLTLSFQDLWWAGPLENGWGLSVVQHADRLFNVFFVYDAGGKPTWYVQPGGTWHGLMGELFVSPVYAPRGSPWFAYDATRFSPGNPAGQAQFDFRGPTEAYVAVNVSDRSMYKHIGRQDFSRAAPSPLQGVADMWWGGPEQTGWGIVILEQPGGLFAVWFTYDEAGLPIWFVMPGGAWTDASTYTGTIYRTAGPAWVGATYDPSRLQVTALGPYTLRFAGTNAATLEYSIDGRTGVLQLQRQPF